MLVWRLPEVDVTEARLVRHRPGGVGLGPGPTAVAASRVVTVVLALLALLASVAGCMTTSADVVVHDTRTVSIEVDIVPDRQSWADQGGMEQLDGIVRMLRAAAPATIEVERIDSGRSAGFRLRWDHASVESVTRPVSFGQGHDAPVLRLFDDFRVMADGQGVWQLDATVPPLAQSAALLTSGIVDEVAGADVAVRIHLPGRIVATNAPSRDRSSATWIIVPGSSTATDLFARSEPGLGLSPTTTALLGSVALIAVGSVLVFVADRWRVNRRLRRSVSDRRGHERRWRTGSPDAQRRSDDVRPPAPQRGMYQDDTGDESVALPVGGAAWGPSPPHPRRDDTRGSHVRRSALEPGSPTVTEHARRSELGSEPPIRPAEALMPPGWYADPDLPVGVRYWDGTAWTEHRA